MTQLTGIEELFSSAVELDREGRAAFLQAACGEDSRLREEVEYLLKCHEEAKSFLEKPAFLPTFEGKRIGPYRMVRELGRGGMGAVYLAARADAQYEKQVALKILKRGMDTDFILRRFYTERQILANLDHPHIARLLDGGTTEDGLPYFVMQYVEGEPITQYCERRKLPIRSRLELFQKVCSAVHYAHQHLVIHRDIKPGNILVTAEDEPVLLDFGIAKLIAPGGADQTLERTIAAQRFLTPDYASPEQLAGLTVTTATDIYSLGLVLGELLSRKRASGEQLFTDQERTRSLPVGHGDAPAGQPTGDLENIVLMATRQEPERRYASVAQLSEDIRRCLGGLPVLARKDTFWYRTSKFIRRNRAAVLALAAVLVVLMGGMIATVWEAEVARRERSRAEQRTHQIRRLAHAFVSEVEDAISTLPGSTQARGLLLKKAVAQLDELAKEGADDPSFLRELALAYRKAGDIQGQPYKANLGKTAEALQSYRKTAAILEKLSAREPNKLPHSLDLSLAYERLASVLIRMNEWPEALEFQRKTTSLREKLAAADGANVEYQRLLAAGYLQMGDLLTYTKDLRGALLHYSEAQKIRKKVAEAGPDNLDALRELGQSYHRIGSSYQNFAMVLSDGFGDLEAAHRSYTAAWENYRQALKIGELLVEVLPSNPQYRRFLADMLAENARAMTSTGHLVAALQYYHQAIAIFNALSAEDASNVEARFDLVTVYRDLGTAYARQGKTSGAFQNYEKALDLSESIYKADRTNRESVKYLHGIHYLLAQLLEEAGDQGGAERIYRNALTVSENSWRTDPGNFASTELYAQWLFGLGNFLAKRGDAREAASATTRALAVLKELADRSQSPDVLSQYSVALATCRPESLRDPDQALTYALRSVEVRDEKDPRTLGTLMLVYYWGGNSPQAVETARRGLALIPQFVPERDAAVIQRNIEKVVARF